VNVTRETVLLNSAPGDTARLGSAFRAIVKHQRYKELEVSCPLGRDGSNRPTALAIICDALDMSHRVRLLGCLLICSIDVMSDVIVFVASVGICAGTPIFD
jgi:hypothetical protein